MSQQPAELDRLKEELYQSVWTSLQADGRIAFASQLDKLVSRALELGRAQAPAWQPIETYVDRATSVPVVVWNGLPWLGFYAPYEGWLADVDGEMLRIDPQPTLWLPAPPSTGAPR